jgi:hypothetical protein
VVKKAVYLYQQTSTITQTETDMTRKDKKELAIKNKIQDLKMYCEQITKTLQTTSVTEIEENIMTDNFYNSHQIIFNLETYGQETKPIFEVDNDPEQTWCRICY